tara:strand:- start:236 stop:1417 length:1182 start_codon:yes stop_codon:yes gene_type:complete
MAKIRVNSSEDFWVDVSSQKSFIEIDSVRFEISYQINIQIEHSTNTVVTVFSSSDEGIATVSATGLVSYVSDGYVTITATSSSNGQSQSNTLYLQLYYRNEQPDDPFNYPAGSLGAHLAANGQDLVGVATDAGRTDSNVFSSVDHAGAVYVRNTNCWYNDWDISGIAVWNSSSGSTRKAGHVTSRDTVTCAAHYSVPTGTVFRFVTMDNVVVERTVIDQRYVLNYDGTYWDSQVCLLNSPLPTTIKVYKYLPPTYTKKFPFLTNGNYLQNTERFWINQDRIAGLRSGQFSGVGSPEFPQYTVQARGGDSGSAGLMSFEGELVNGAGISGNICVLRAYLIQQNMTLLGSAYPIQYVDIDAYADYNNVSYPDHSTANNPNFPDDALVPSAYKNFN